MATASSTGDCGKNSRDDSPPNHWPRPTNLARALPERASHVLSPNGERMCLSVSTGEWKGTALVWFHRGGDKVLEGEIMLERIDCALRVFPSRGSSYQCQRPATIERNGRWYCWQHDPEYIEKKEQEKRKKWEMKQARNAAQYARRNAERTACRDVPTEVLLTVKVADLLKRESR